MKRLLLISIISLIPAVDFYAQSAADSAVYNDGISLLDKAKTTDNYLEAAFYFEQLATQYPKQWLVMYFAAYSYIQASQKALVSNDMDALLDRAQLPLNKAFALKPNEPELQVLQAFLYQTRIPVNPLVRGLSYSQKAEACLKKAVAADPSNPRAVTLMAYNIYFTPAMFGGGASKALPLFLKAKGKYPAFVPALPFMPDWGERENQEMINTCKKTKN
jgi:tetratricopeptide (TPR) repeat protein